MSDLINLNYTAFFSISPKPDDEWQRIIDRLLYVYGIHSTGSKSADKAKLHELELQKAIKEHAKNTSKFLTLTQSELEKIIQKDREKQKELYKIDQNTNNGAEILGTQLYIAILMKNNKDNSENKNKRHNKYNS